ncbi:MAG: hypothetical protein QM703_01360 [Gemmatales bacterium]
MSTSNKNVVTPLKKEPVMLFGTNIPSKAIAPEKPKAPPPPPPAPAPVAPAAPVAQAAPVAVAPKPVENPFPSLGLKPAPAAAPAVRPAKVKVVDNTVRKFADLNRRQQVMDDEVEAELARAWAKCLRTSSTPLTRSRKARRARVATRRARF